MTRILTTIALLFATPALIGCSVSLENEGWNASTLSRLERLPDNQFLVSCAGNGLASCYQRMAAVCPSGYEELKLITAPTAFITSYDIFFKCEKQ